MYKILFTVLGRSAVNGGRRAVIMMKNYWWLLALLVMVSPASSEQSTPVAIIVPISTVSSSPLVAMPISDQDVPVKFQAVCAKWRALATAQAIDNKTPITWEIQPGRRLAFWIPMFPAESTNKSEGEQKAWLAGIRKQYGLPDHHLSSFGSGVLVAALMLAHKARAGEELPVQPNWVRTDTFGVSEYLEDSGKKQWKPRLTIGFGLRGLDRCTWGPGAVKSVGCFLLGVEELGP